MVWRSNSDSGSTRRRRLCALIGVLVIAVLFASPALPYQGEGSTDGTETAAENATPGPSSKTVDEGEPVEDPSDEADQGVEGINLLSLFWQGSWFMIPILLMSLITVTFIVERFLGLRRTRVIPAPLVREIGQMGTEGAQFDPRQAYKICQRFPSAAAKVIQVMLLKVGRPHSEVEHAVAEASEREAERLYANVRWLNLSAAVAPLMGLLGTVWGMIRAFHDTTQLQPGQNKADYLANGIYTALVTTLGGLMVAIPAAIFAHYFETRVQKLFHEVDEMVFNLAPQIERFEGRVRFSRQGAEGSGQPPPEPEAAGVPSQADD